MESASNEQTVTKNSRICENVKKSEIKLDGFFKSNSWKATLVIVLVRKYEILDEICHFSNEFLIIIISHYRFRY